MLCRPIIIHQDYRDHTRKAVIQFFTDGMRFWNPGDSFGDDARLLEPGEKEVRNPSIAMAMRRIAMCEQAGTGLRMMQREWKALGHAAPRHTNDRVYKAFETFLPEPRLRAVAIAPHDTPHVTPHEPPHVSDELGRLLDAMSGEMHRDALRAAPGLRDRKHFQARY